MQKKCARCGKVLNASCFHSDSSRTDGLCQHCKECRREKGRLYNIKNHESILAKKKTYYSNNKEQCMEASRAWCKTDGGKKRLAAIRRRQVLSNPEAHRARGMLRYNVWLGKIKKPDACEECGATGVRICGHHHNGYDIEHRFDVIWLCDPCHHRAHLAVASFV